MPFTFAHPAVVLPLNQWSKKYFSLTGLVIGSLVPDFEYFMRMEVQSIYSHTIQGLFWFDVPLGILLAFLFHGLVRNSLFNNLPYFLQARFFSFQAFNWPAYWQKNWAIIVFSILLGAISHLLWDGFTHRTGYFVEHWPALQQSINILGKKIFIFKILQHASTLTGLIVVAYYVFKMSKTTHPQKPISLSYWTTLIIIASTIFLLRQPLFIGDIIVTTIGALLTSMVLGSWYERLKNKS